MNSTQSQKDKPVGAQCGKFSWKFILLSFLALVVYVFISLLSSTSKLSVIVDMSIKMRGNVMGVLNNLVDISSTDAVNGTISFPEGEELPIKRGRTIKFMFTDGRKRTFYKTISPRNMDKPMENKPLSTYDPHSKNSTYYVDSYSADQDNNSEENGSSLYGSILKTDLNESHEWEGNTSEIDKYGNNVNTKVKIRQRACDSCFHHNFKYVIENEKICEHIPPDGNIDLLILILTTHKNTRSRSALRSTWLSYTKNNTGNVRYVFLLGETGDNMHREAVLAESQRFHDIIKEDFLDSYANLTYKTIMGFKWAATKCAHARYVMKTDDDMFVNIPNILKMLSGPDSSDLQSSVFGACSKKARPIRNRKSKWFASMNSYPDQVYPGFCSGTGYVTSMHVATAIYKISPSVPFFHLEDIYVSLCIKKLGFKLKGIRGFNPGRPKLDPCIYKGPQLITAHQLTPIMLQLIWNRWCTKSPVNISR